MVLAPRERVFVVVLVCQCPTIGGVNKLRTLKTCSINISVKLKPYSTRQSSSWLSFAYAHLADILELNS